MAHGLLTDNGRQVLLDLHGLKVDQALDLIRRTVQEARRRGRATIKLVHGSSTSSLLYQNRTIKHEVIAALENGEFGPVGSVFHADDYVIFSLPVGRVADNRPIRLSDVC